MPLPFPTGQRETPTHLLNMESLFRIKLNYLNSVTFTNTVQPYSRTGRTVKENKYKKKSHE